MRPIYQTASDLSVATIVAKAAADYCSPQFDLLKLPSLSSADFIFSRNNEAAKLVEVKARTVRSTDFDTYLISMDKLQRLHGAAQELKIMPLLIVKWVDAVGVHIVQDPVIYETRTGGRRDRLDPRDIELCAYIPIESFDLLHGVLPS